MPTVRNQHALDGVGTVESGGRGPAPYRLLFTSRIIALLDLLRRRGAMAHKREFDLSELEWRIMVQVGDHAPLSLNGLAELLTQDPGQLSRAVKAMVGRGLLTRERQRGSPAIQIGLSEEGRRVHAAMVDLAIRSESMLLSGIAQQDIDTVAKVLDVLVEKAGDLLEKERNLARP